MSLHINYAGLGRCVSAAAALGECNGCKITSQGKQTKAGGNELMIASKPAACLPLLSSSKNSSASKHALENVICVGANETETIFSQWSALRLRRRLLSIFGASTQPHE